MARLRRTLALSAVVASAAAALAVTSATAENTRVGRYVALGDSFTSGTGVPAQVDLVCTRSDRNYPSLLAAAIKPAKFVDVSCGGATTKDLTGRQFGIVAPQYDALTKDTDLVTMGMGGNDVGFAEIIVRCGALSLTNPLGSPCKDSLTAGGKDQLRERFTAFAPKLGEAVRGIKERAPKARVVLVGYPAILPPKDGCFPIVPISRGDVAYLDGVNQLLNSIVAEQAAANGAEFVDAFTSSRGHDVCTPPGTKWVEGLLPTDAAAPVHPNAAGLRNTAARVIAAIG
ncbi:lysophospholipase L1-like esterase [Herbihabitans rhizosphaerae]|uniref:Lysophospholipase L1-like esterase n=1 Tax=Herbihabitans rhizosphaerae TaxID=1872711 RepID=A0A4Q7KIN5_9PSEU|nr:SGNH/GDSL hydrolase family protein [Herbihabitans rhizosphaerae]RZS36399.1 lysophospholipase L1-like esterase [Herbihabitans rhizosphaerae]